MPTAPGQFSRRLGLIAALATQVKTVTFAPNQFRFGKLVRNARKGTEKLRIKVPVGVKVALSAKKVKRARRSIPTVRVSFRPTGGIARSKAKSIQLILN